MSRKDTDSGQKSAVSLKDVARVANVSFQTVSRALRQSGYVGPETRARIEAAVEHLGYRPNVNARALVQRTSDVVAIVLPSNVSLVVRNPYIGEVFAGITETVEAEGFHVMLDVSRGRQTYGDVYLDRRAAGLVLMNVPEDDAGIEDLRRRDVPFALTCRVATPDVSFVAADDEGGGYLATTHLIELGHRRIGYLGGPPRLATTRLRTAGYHRAMQEAGLAVEPRWIGQVEAFSESTGHTGGAQLLAAAPELTAVVTPDDMMALGVMLAAQEHSRTVPADLSVVGFNDITLARYVRPALTTIRQDAYRKGQIAAQLLLARIAGADAKTEHVILPTELIVRDSTTRARA